MSHDTPIKVAIVGGGCAAVTTAFELTRPELHGRYEVTLYQLGWRLGGKGASGRGPADRIEEHGLHLWMGFYENAFRIMRECYAELERDPNQYRIADWRDAFYPDAYTGLADRGHQGGWTRWLAYLPPMAGQPGDPLSEQNPFTIPGYLLRTVNLLRAVLISAQARYEPEPVPPARPNNHPDSVIASVIRLLKYGQLATMAGLIEAVELLETILGAIWRYPDSLVLRLLKAMSAGARRLVSVLIEGDDEMRRIWEMVDVVLAVLRGIVRFGLITDPRGFDAINDYDWREWLRLNGAAEGSVNSAFIRGSYDLLFAYEHGDVNRPRMAAGQALRGALRMFFTYRGALFWKMTAGMGDIVFAPFYEVLQRRGVRFEFFHRLENVKLAAADSFGPDEKPYVEALEFDIQAEITNGEYQPLVDVRGLPCWPAVPDYTQLVDGDRLRQEAWDFESHWDRRKAARKILRVTEDFDFVVLGVGLGAIPHLCSEILERDARWRTMVERVGTVATQAFQVWLDADLDQLGWNAPSVTLSAFVEPFDTWADMSHLIEEESWQQKPLAIAYFCSVLPSPEAASRDHAEYPGEQFALVRQNAIRFLERDIVHLWPLAAPVSGEFRWELLVDSQAKSAAAATSGRFDQQYWTANVNPTDRYVLSLPGTLDCRISPLDNTYDNLSVAGDWTDCGHHAGCVEAAVMSGLLAAHAIAQTPALESIIGYDHP